MYHNRAAEHLGRMEAPLNSSSPDFPGASSDLRWVQSEPGSFSLGSGRPKLESWLHVSSRVTKNLVRFSIPI